MIHVEAGTLGQWKYDEATEQEAMRRAAHLLFEVDEVKIWFSLNVPTIVTRENWTGIKKARGL